MNRRVAVIVVAMVVMAVTPWFIFGVYLPGFVTTEGALDRSLCARSALPVEPPPGHLTVVIVDGLGFAYAAEAPELAWLRAASAMRPLDVDFPSYTTPALLSFTTGVGPAESGVRLNAEIRAATLGLDNLRASAESVGRPIDFFDGGWKPFRQIMFTDDRVLWRGRRARDAAPFVSRGDRGLRMIYFGDVDAAGHEQGAASRAYRDASIRASRYLRRCSAMLGPNDRLLVVSDHGHLAEGGHGGVEPEILSATFAALGRDVRRGEVLARRGIDDVASTIATLAGIPTPACNRGQPMLDMLELDDATRERLARPALEQQRTLASKVAPVDDDGRAWRVAIVVLLTLLLGAVGRRQLPPLRAWLAPVAFVAGYVGFLALRGYRLTFSKMPQQPDFIRDAIIASVIATTAALAYAWWWRASRADVALLAGAGLPMLLMCAWVGIDPRIVPPPYLGLAVILWSPTLLSASLCAIALAIRPAAHPPSSPGA